MRFSLSELFGNNYGLAASGSHSYQRRISVLLSYTYRGALLRS